MRNAVVGEQAIFNHENLYSPRQTIVNSSVVFRLYVTRMQNTGEMKLDESK